jgi:hypothetical protein
MQQRTYQRSRGWSHFGSFPVSFRFYDRSLDLFQFVGESFGEASVLLFRLMVIVQEWMSRRLVW